MSDALLLLVPLFGTLLLAKVLGELSERLGQPELVGEVLAGVVIANLVVGGFVLRDFLGLGVAPTGGSNPNLDFLQGLGDLGVLFLVFSVGLGMPAREIRKVGLISLKVAVLGVAVPFILGFGFVTFAVRGGPPSEALFVAAAMVATSVGITARLLHDRNLQETREAKVILGAAVIDDVLGILILAMAVGLAAKGSADLLELAKIAAVAGTFVFLVGIVGPRLVRRVGNPGNPRSLVGRLRTPWAVYLLALLLCFGLSALASYLKMAAVIGAFLGGMVMAEISEAYHLERPFRILNVFFVPFFFIVIGLQVDLGALAAVLPIAVALILLAVAGKLIGGTLGARGLGRSASVVGVGMVPRGEVGILVAATGLQSGFLSPGMYGALVLMSIVTSLITPMLLSRLLPERKRSDLPPSIQVS